MGGNYASRMSQDTALEYDGQNIQGRRELRDIFYFRFRRTGSGEVRVEVQALLGVSTRRLLIGITGQQVEDVIAATVSGLDDQGQVGRQGTVVGGLSGLLVLVRAGYVVGEFTGTLLDISLVVGLSVVLVLFGHGLHFVDGGDGADEGAPWDTAEGVAGGADFTVDLESSAETVLSLLFSGLCSSQLEVLGVMATYAWWSKDLVHFMCSQG